MAQFIQPQFQARPRQVPQRAPQQGVSVNIGGQNNKSEDLFLLTLLGQINQAREAQSRLAIQKSLADVQTNQAKDARRQRAEGTLTERVQNRLAQKGKELARQQQKTFRDLQARSRSGAAKIAGPVGVIRRALAQIAEGAPAIDKQPEIKTALLDMQRIASQSFSSLDDVQRFGLTELVSTVLDEAATQVPQDVATVRSNFAPALNAYPPGSGARFVEQILQDQRTAFQANAAQRGIEIGNKIQAAGDIPLDEFNNRFSKELDKLDKTGIPVPPVDINAFRRGINETPVIGQRIRERTTQEKQGLSGTIPEGVRQAVDNAGRFFFGSNRASSLGPLMSLALPGSFSSQPNTSSQSPQLVSEVTNPVSTGIPAQKPGIKVTSPETLRNANGQPIQPFSQANGVLERLLGLGSSSEGNTSTEIPITPLSFNRSTAPGNVLSNPSQIIADALATGQLGAPGTTAPPVFENSQNLSLDELLGGNTLPTVSPFNQLVGPPLPSGRFNP